MSSHEGKLFTNDIDQTRVHYKIYSILHGKRSRVICKASEVYATVRKRVTKPISSLWKTFTHFEKSLE